MADIAETHTSYPALVHFRSPNSGRSWITSMIAVMDAAAIQLARAPSTAPGTARLVITGGSATTLAICTALKMPVVSDPLLLTLPPIVSVPSVPPSVSVPVKSWPTTSPAILPAVVSEPVKSLPTFIAVSVPPSCAGRMRSSQETKMKLVRFGAMFRLR